MDVMAVGAGMPYLASLMSATGPAGKLPTVSLPCWKGDVRESSLPYLLTLPL